MTGDPAGTDWRQVRRLLRPRATRVQAVVATLCVLLGFGLVVQVRSTGRDSGLRSARQEDLIRILDDLTARSDRLRREVDTLAATRARLSSGTDSSRTAVTEAQRRAQTLGVLAGTVPATGTGIRLTVIDPQGAIRAEVLLDALEELRDAGAEAVQLGSVRVVAATYLLDAPAGGIVVDATVLRPPYRFTVLGDPRTLAAALAIPGGVTDTVGLRAGASVVVEQSGRLTVTALRPLTRPRYARPAPGGG